MKTKITKKSLTDIRELIIKPYFNLYDILQFDLKEKRFTISQKLYSKEQAKSWHFSPQFMPLQIQNIIRKQHLKCFEVSISLDGGATFVVRLHVHKTQKFDHKIEDTMLKALSTMVTMSRISSCDLRNKRIILRMFDTDIQKFFPSVGQTIRHEHVNSAYTESCRYSESPEVEIVIFRQEEWLKVLFHELMHTYSLDIGTDTGNIVNKLSKMFGGLECKFNLTEAYCEFWARVIWTMISCASSLEHQIIGLVEQQEWAIQQAYNVLLRMNYQEKSCQETTAAFSYYVITAYLLTGFPAVFDWCSRNCNMLLDFPKTHQGTNSFLQLIDEIVHSKVIHAKWAEIVENGREGNISSKRITSRMSYI